MKKLLLFTLIIGLFAGCKKDTTPADPCYVGTWEGDLSTIANPAYTTNFFESAPTMTLFADNTGLIKFTVLPTAKVNLAGYTIRLGVSYTISTDQKITFYGISTSYAIGSAEPVQQPMNTSYIMSYFSQIGTHTYVCDTQKITFSQTAFGPPLYITKWNRK
jgi:hypothetical protein